jgi:hypothetical protein
MDAKLHIDRHSQIAYVEVYSTHFTLTHIINPWPMALLQSQLSKYIRHSIGVGGRVPQHLKDDIQSRSSTYNVTVIVHTLSLIP